MSSVKDFEFGRYFALPEGSRSGLHSYLNGVWQERFASNAEDLDEGQSIREQGFLSFDGGYARARNYVGFVQTDQVQVEIYPKVFKNHCAPTKENTRIFLKHLFYWFSYCRKWKFPVTEVDLDSCDCSDIPELFINLMASRMYEVVSANPLLLYEEVEEQMSVPRGRFAFGRYIQRGMASGNHHQLECDHEPFRFDNRMNRAIKYVARLLATKTKFQESRERLGDILFILDEVDDVPCTSGDLHRTNISPFFSEYHSVIDICHYVLDQQLHSTLPYQTSHWCLLFPMEYVFEDFIAGFLEHHFSKDWKVEYQKSDLYLSSDPKAFQMQHDIFLTSKAKPEVKIIVDAKYKLRPAGFKEDKKKGVAQPDLYQMASYAYKRGCQQVLLLYPNKGEQCETVDTFNIGSGFGDDVNISVTACEIPFWSMNDFNTLEGSLRKFMGQYLEALS